MSILEPLLQQIPQRAGPPPETRRPSRARRVAHQQLTQNAPPELQETLFERARALPGVQVGPSLVSVPGARAFFLEEHMAQGPAGAFQRGLEFAHLHPSNDGSLHLTLPPAAQQVVLDKGWGEPHPISGTPMIYGPRDAQELEVVWRLLLLSYRFARGEAQEANV